MSWLFLILLVLTGAREPDARYGRACARLAQSTGDRVTCASLGAPAPPPLRPIAPRPIDTDPTVGISNGF